MKVLVLDDDITTRKILEVSLKAIGFEVVSYSSPHEVLKLYFLDKESFPKLSLIDWIMPGMSGLELCKTIRKARTNNPPYLIMLTAKDTKNDIIAGLNAGANDYIIKPFNKHELIARINVGRRMVELQDKLIRAYKTMEVKAMHDPLTGVYNRGAIIEELSRDIAKAYRQGTALNIAMLDIDHFKKVNDTYGHQAGDDVLIQVTGLVKNNLRDYDFIGRYGGEEFLLAFEPRFENSEVFIKLLERIREEINSTPIKTRAGNINITVSIGGAIAVKNVSDSIAKVDKALYAAKETGRNKIVFFN